MTKKVDNILKNSETNPHKVLMLAPVIICISKGPNHVYELANEMYIKVVGNRDIIGKPIREALPELEGQGFFELLDEVYKTGKPFIGHEMLATIDKGNGKLEDGFFNFTYQAILDSHGNIEGIMVFAMEVTQHVIARKENEDIIRNLALIVESSNDAILSKSLDGTIISWNTGAEKMYGYASKESVGKHISFIIPSEYMNEEKEINEKIRNNETIEHYETVRMKKNGEIFYISLSASPLINQGGNIVGISVIARDVSERKKAEDSSKLKDAFLSIISHEIRTPLNAIMGFSDILTNRKLGEQEKEYVNIIKSSGDDLLKILNDVIDMSKLEVGTMDFEVKSFSVKEIFHSLNKMLTGKVQEKNLTLLFACDKDVPDTLLGDQTRLAQIITSLITNAINFTEKGTINVRASVIKKEKTNTLLTVSVTDTGIGISLDKIKTTFDRFRQIENYDTRKQGGMGLGLSIAKRLVDLQDGSMTVESELKKGSTFKFCIPYKN